jgi:hypothetical protein
MFRRTLFALTLLLVPLAAPIQIEAQRVLPDDEWCDDDSGNSRDERYCEVREFSLDAQDLIRVDAEPNGGIRVEAWDGNGITLRAKVQAWSRNGDPREIVEDIRIETGRTISPDGPDTGRREGWSVSFHLMVPRNTNLDLESQNGGIKIVGVHGNLDFETQNGGVTLEEVGGDVHGRTQNGGVKVLLTGSQLDGERLDVETKNGSVSLTVPENFRANLETGTVNGSFNTDFPITIRGQLRSRRITTELNGGGPSIRLVTTNGSVRLRSS